MQNNKERAATAQRAALASQQEFMSLAEGVGIIPEKYRNRGFAKLDYEPGEGGIGGLLADRDEKGGGTMDAFLAGVASGSDPQKLASELRSGTTTRRRGGKEVSV